MKVSMELNVSDKEFYDLMMKSLKEEVKNVTKKDLELKEGLKYKKKSAQRKGIGSEITVHIKRLLPNELYVATFNTAIDHTTISYKIESLNESKIKVTYEEIYENVSSKKEMLQQLLSLRKQYNEGNQEDYFDHPHLIGWIRRTQTKAMAIIMTNSNGGIKSMYVGKEDRHCYYVNVFNGYQRVLINEDGYGDFYCEDKNFAVYVKE